MAATKPCAFCGKEFEVCAHCEEIRQQYMASYGYAPWRTVACSAECYQIYDVVRRYNFGQITIKEAHDLLCNVDIPDLTERPETKDVIDKILAYVEPQPVQKTKAKK